MIGFHIGHAISIGKTLELEWNGKRQVRKVALEPLIVRNIYNLAPNDENQENRLTQWHTFSSSKYRALFKAAVRTPCGLQLNLYLSGARESSGAGRPPQNDVNETISLF